MDRTLAKALELLAPRVFRYLCRVTGDREAAEELTQETMLRAWRYRQQLVRPDARSAWVFRIASNLAKDAIRRRKQPFQELDESRAGCAGPSPHRRLEQREDVQRTLDMIAELPPRQRAVVHLQCCEEMSTAEIAETMGISREAVKASLSVARRRLRERLSDTDPVRTPPASVPENQ